MKNDASPSGASGRTYDRAGGLLGDGGRGRRSRPRRRCSRSSAPSSGQDRLPLLQLVEPGLRVVVAQAARGTRARRADGCRPGRPRARLPTARPDRRRRPARPSRRTARPASRRRRSLPAPAPRPRSGVGIGAGAAGVAAGAAGCGVRRRAPGAAARCSFVSGPRRYDIAHRVVKQPRRRRTSRRRPGTGACRGHRAPCRAPRRRRRPRRSGAPRARAPCRSRSGGVRPARCRRSTSPCSRGRRGSGSRGRDRARTRAPA